MPVLFRLTALIVLTVWLAASPAHARRVALVIGNAAYTQGPLANPVNDAEAIGDALRDLGFTKVIRVQNATKAQMERALGEMATESQGAEMAVVFFAGHGTERDGRNYLIPVDAKLDRASDLDLQAIALPIVLDQIAGATKLKLVILDACRNTIFPLAGSRRSATRGLARIEPEDNTLVAYAAKDGTVAQDGAGAKHSPFTAALLKHVTSAETDIRLVLGRVRDDVRQLTQKQQSPHVYGTLGGSVLSIASTATATPTEIPGTTKPLSVPEQTKATPASKLTPTPLKPQTKEGRNGVSGAPAKASLPIKTPSYQQAGSSSPNSTTETKPTFRPERIEGWPLCSLMRKEGARCRSHGRICKVTRLVDNGAGRIKPEWQC